MANKTKKKISIIDVAKEAGVSVATVSRVLNNKKGAFNISVETHNSVLVAANKLHYVIDPFASALRSGKTGLLGAVIRDTEDPFLEKLLKELHNKAWKKNIDLLVGYANYDLAIARRSIDVMISHFFDGLFLIGDISGNEELINRIREANTPFVIVAHGVVDDLHAINVNEEQGVHLAIDYLKQLGHKKIAVLGDLTLAGTRQRIEIFIKYFHDRDECFRNDFVYECKNDRLDASQKVMDLMSLSDPPTAIFCTTDVIALGAINRLLSEGFSIPGDVSILGYDNISDSRSSYPSLTTISQCVDKMADESINLLQEIMKNQNYSDLKECVKIEPELIIRDSCGNPRTNSNERIVKL